MFPIQLGEEGKTKKGGPQHQGPSRTSQAQREEEQEEGGVVEEEEGAGEARKGDRGRQKGQEMFHSR